MEKDQLRVDLGRSTSDPTRGPMVTSALFTWLSSRLPGTVAAYLAMRDEVDIAPLFDRLPGWRWVLPRVESADSITFRDRDVPRERHELGMEQPVDQGRAVPVAEIDVFLVPGMAFDRSGGRLGRGGGHYDRLLALKRADAVSVGVTVEARVIASVPVHDHDRRVDWLATEAGVSQCSPSS